MWMVDFYGKNVGKYTSSMDAKRVMSHAESARSFSETKRQDLSKSGTSWAGGILTTEP